MVPSIQSLFNGWGKIKAQTFQLEKVLDALKKNDTKVPKRVPKYKSNKLNFSESIELKNLSFKYDTNQDFILENLNLRIKKGEFIGIVGDSGSGKSTLADIIMGLLSPTSGKVLIDGELNKLQNIEVSVSEKNVNIFS